MRDIGDPAPALTGAEGGPATAILPYVRAYWVASRALRGLDKGLNTGVAVDALRSMALRCPHPPLQRLAAHTLRDSGLEGVLLLSDRGLAHVSTRESLP